MPPNFVTIIPARGGSKGIPRKNVKLMAGKPLIAYSIEESLQCKDIDRTIVSTEDNEIMEISRRYGAEVIERPKELSRDDTPTEPVLEHVINYLENEEGYFPDYIILLQPTSPLRERSDITNAISTILKEKADSLLSVYENNNFLWDRKRIEPLNYDMNNRPRRQDKDWELVENGAIYITKRDVFKREGNRLGGKIVTSLMPQWRSYEIDEPYEFELVEHMLITRKRKIDLSDKINKIKLLIFDVDGVFTDGSVYLNEDGQQTLKFSRIDGKGIALVRNQGIRTAVITSENSQIVQQRMNKLNIKDVYIGIQDKIRIYEALKEKYSLIDEEICFCGDDVQDLEVIQNVGLSCCPSNAQEIIKKSCDYKSNFSGGMGFVRDICNLICDLENR